MCKLSIVVPIYNVISYLYQCVASIIEQTFDDYEVLLIDDGSCDGSGKLCDYFSSKYSNIHTFHRENRGPGCARNFGMDMASGKYILFVDADDYLAKEALEILIMTIETTKCDEILFGGVSFKNAEFNDSNGMMRNYKRKSLLSEVVSGKEMLRKSLLNGDYYTVVFLRLFSTNYLKLCNIRFGEEGIHEDEGFGIISLLCAEKVISIPNILYFRRCRSNSIMSSLKIKDSVLGLERAFEQIMDFFKDNTDAEIQILCRKYGLLLQRQAMMRLYMEENDDLLNELVSTVVEVNNKYLKSINFAWDKNLMRFDGNNGRMIADTVSSYYLQFELMRNSLISVVPSDEPVILWGYGKRGKDLSLFFQNHKYNKIYITDKRFSQNSSIEVMEYPYIPITDAASSGWKIIATNYSIYCSLVEKNVPNLINLDNYCC